MLTFDVSRVVETDHFGSLQHIQSWWNMMTFLFQCWIIVSIGVWQYQPSIIENKQSGSRSNYFLQSMVNVYRRIWNLRWCTSTQKMCVTHFVIDSYKSNGMYDKKRKPSGAILRITYLLWWTFINERFPTIKIHHAQAKRLEREKGLDLNKKDDLEYLLDWTHSLCRPRKPNPNKPKPQQQQNTRKFENNGTRRKIFFFLQILCRRKWENIYQYIPLWAYIYVNAC